MKKRLISIFVSLAILGLIYWRVDLSEMVDVFTHAHALWLTLAILMTAATVAATAWRLKMLAPDEARLGIGESTRLILAASVLNMVLPSKMGDIAKAYFIRQRGHLPGGLALSLVIYEKACDVLALLLWCVLGLLLYPQKDALFWTMTAFIACGLVMGLLMLGSRGFANLFFRSAAKAAPGKIARKIESLQTSWSQMHSYFWQDPARLARTALMSVFIWFLHLLQIWLFIIALGAQTPFAASLGLTPLAILAGLLPLTFAGVGTRDAALIYFYTQAASFTGFTPATGVALGLLCTLRYVLPAVGGLPFFQQYLAVMNRQRAHDAAQPTT